MDDTIARVVSTRTKGRSVVAKCLIKAGTVVVRERPVACVPSVDSSLESISIHRGPYQLSTDEIRIKPPPTVGLHRSTVLSFSGNLCVLAARCFHASVSSSREKERFLLLRNHMGNNGEDCNQLPGLNECVEIVLALVCSSASKADNLASAEDCRAIICNLVCNLFSIVDDFQNEAGIGCYPYAALLNHSCAPNCIQRFDEEGTIIIRTHKDVRPGEELCISYIDTAMPTWYRQRELLQGYRFHCQCARCSMADLSDSYVCPKRQLSTLGSHGATNRADGSGVGTGCKGLCYPAYESSVYQGWAEGSVPVPSSATATANSCAINRTAQMGKLPALPFPYKWLLRTAPAQPSTKECTESPSKASTMFVCESCGAERNGQEISTAIEAILRVTLDDSLNGVIPNNKSGDYGALSVQQRCEALYHEIKRFESVLPRLLRLVPEHHYCVLQLRKYLKGVFEQSLPIREGVLLFPTISMSRTKAATGAQVSTEGTEGKSGGEVAMKGAELQGLYQDNLRQILAIQLYCYGTTTTTITTAPTLCNTYYRLQYVWFVLAKHESLLDGTGAGAVAPDVMSYREVHRMLPQLLRDLRVVYGGDHAFVASAEQCAAEISRYL